MGSWLDTDRDMAYFSKRERTVFEIQIRDIFTSPKREGPISEL